MEKKKEGFEGQQAIVIPRKIIKKYCTANPLISNACVTDIGYFPKAKYHFRERISGSEQHILIYCLEGKGKVQIKNDVYELNPSEFIIIPHGMPHKYAAHEITPWTIYWIHFRGETTNKIIKILKNKCGSLKSIVNFQESRIKLFEDIYFNLEMGYSNDNLSYVSLCFVHLLSSFIYNDNYSISGKKQNLDQINSSIIYMQNNLDKTLPIGKIAQSVNLSPSHFSYLFKKKTGFSPIEYFNHLKVQKACQYLLLTELRIKEIAEKIGMEDPYYFSRMFTKVMGISPVNYRIRRIN